MTPSTEKTALITGASSGIGAAFARSEKKVNAKSPLSTVEGGTIPSPWGDEKG